eukprot:13775519-Alexandrium_andersonii.AAC.1
MVWTCRSCPRTTQGPSAPSATSQTPGHPPTTPPRTWRTGPRRCARATNTNRSAKTRRRPRPKSLPCSPWSGPPLGAPCRAI